MASFAFAVAMIFQDNPERARPSPWNPIRALRFIDHPGRRIVSERPSSSRRVEMRGRVGPELDTVLHVFNQL